MILKLSLRVLYVRQKTNNLTVCLKISKLIIKAIIISLMTQANLSQKVFTILCKNDLKESR